jgi:hypothetical protein
MGNTIYIGSIETDALVDLSEGGTKHQRVDTGVWETAQSGVEYYSSESEDALFGTVYRKYYSGTDFYSDLNAVEVSASLNEHVASGGWISTVLLSKQFPFPWADNDGTHLAKVQSKAFTIGTYWDSNYKIWVDYTKV